jgi:hypothetical protein
VNAYMLPTCFFAWTSLAFSPFRHLRKISESDSLLRPVRPSAWNNSAFTGQILMKCDIRVFFSKICAAHSSFIEIRQK